MRILLTFLLGGWALCASAQQKTSAFTKFGKITAEHLQKKIYSLDSNANAVVLSDIGDARIEGNSKSSFSISFNRHRVVHVLNKSGYHEADVEIYLYKVGDVEEELENIKAITYNLENGKVTETKLDKGSIFTEKRTRNQVVKKFTMPNVKEGSIIEFQYEVISDFIWNLDPWYFQGSSPVLWSEYNLQVPEFFTYTFLSHGYHGMYINDRKDKQELFNVSETRGTGATERATFTAGVTNYRWAMKDLPELKRESYTSATKNHLSSIEFQLASQNYPLTPRNYRTTWPALTRELLESEDFGSALRKDNNWLADELKPLLEGSSSRTDKARKIFEYVRDNYTCVDNTPGAIWASQSLKNVSKNRKGNVSDINLLLTAMLRYAEIDAEPVILSTTDHGYALDMYPMTSNFNYVISKYTDNEKEIFLDASNNKLGFGKLPAECYNGNARVVNPMAQSILLSADSINERRITALFMSNHEKGHMWGNMTTTAGYYESMRIRNSLKEKGRSVFFQDIEKAFGMDVTLNDPKVDSIDNYDMPVSLKYEMQLKPFTEDLLYINPVFNEGYKTNPFKAAERYYPVEMPYTIDQTFLLTMEVPVGYEIDEMPKQMMAKLDEGGQTFFEYRLSHSNGTISMRSRVKIGKTLFLPEEYSALREFFNLIVKKQSEQIVFRKKK